MITKKIAGKLHLWLGLAAGLIVFIVAVTGVIYAFEEEIRSLYEKKYWYVDIPENSVRFSLTEMKLKAEKIFFNNTPGVSSVAHTDVRFHSDPASSISFVLYNASPLIYKQVFVNPYTGKIIHLKNLANDVFIISLELHRNLLLGSVGKEIIDYASIIFFAMLITGIILWWPRNRSARKKRFRIKVSPNPKRLNYDLHNVLGFYASWIAIILVLTGFVWAFTWYAEGIDWLANGGKFSPVLQPVISDSSKSNYPDNAIDKAYSYAIDNKKGAERFWFGFPKGKEDVITLVSYKSNTVYYNHTHIYFDQYTGELLKKHPYEQTTNGEKILAMAYDIHIGKILGLPGQILASFASLIIASLPITGLRIWLGRKRKSYKKIMVEKNND